MVTECRRERAGVQGGTDFCCGITFNLENGFCGFCHVANVHCHIHKPTFLIGAQDSVPVIVLNESRIRLRRRESSILQCCK